MTEPNPAIQPLNLEPTDHRRVGTEMESLEERRKDAALPVADANANKRFPVPKHIATRPRLAVGTGPQATLNAASLHTKGNMAFKRSRR